jgi:hypothetical protein
MDRMPCIIFRCEKGLSTIIKLIIIIIIIICNRDSYGLDDLGGRSSSPGMVKNVPFSTSSIPAQGSTQSPIQWVPGALSPGIKRQGHETDHSPPTSA